MSPAKLIEKEKRRFSDDPEYTAFRWSIGAVKIIAYFLLGYFAVAGVNFMMDYRKDHSDLENALMGTKFNKDINDMQNLKLENHEGRIKGLEAK